MKNYITNKEGHTQIIDAVTTNKEGRRTIYLYNDWMSSISIKENDNKTFTYKNIEWTL